VTDALAARPEIDAFASRVGIDAFASGVGIDALTHAAWLPWLLLAAAAALALALRARPAALAWPDAARLRAAGARRFDRVRAAALALRALALAALAVALAGPVDHRAAPPEPGSGLDLVLALDASGSMRGLDARVDGEPRTRIALAREVVAHFAHERAAEGDRVALIVFGDTAFTLCPLTSDGALLAASLSRVEAGIAGEATAAGDALALSVKRAGGAAAFDGARAAAAPRAAAPEAGRVVVLLTDGRHNAGSLPLEAATAIAAASAVRVHTVAIGSAGEAIRMAPAPGELALRPRYERHDVDIETLKRVADATGGRFFHARNPADLEAVYAEIGRLERVSRRLPPRVRQSERTEPLLAAAGGLLLLEIALARVLRRRIP
jgi:Ca-activated chloride channel family protein